MLIGGISISILVHNTINYFYNYCTTYKQNEKLQEQKNKNLCKKLEYKLLNSEMGYNPTNIFTNYENYSWVDIHNYEEYIKHENELLNIIISIENIVLLYDKLHGTNIYDKLKLYRRKVRNILHLLYKIDMDMYADIINNIVNYGNRFLMYKIRNKSNIEGSLNYNISNYEDIDIDPIDDVKYSDNPPDKENSNGDIVYDENSSDEDDYAENGSDEDDDYVENSSDEDDDYDEEDKKSMPTLHILNKYISDLLDNIL